MCAFLVVSPTVQGVGNLDGSSTRQGTKIQVGYGAYSLDIRESQTAWSALGGGPEFADHEDVAAQGTCRDKNSDDDPGIA